jgi:hypothetical protein
MYLLVGFVNSVLFISSSPIVAVTAQEATTFKKTCVDICCMSDVKYHTELASWQKFLIALVLVVIIAISAMIYISDVLGVEILGLFVVITGVLLLSLALVRTNDDLLMIAQHPSKKDVQAIITHMATERFQIMLSLFLMVLGFLLQIVGSVF